MLLILETVRVSCSASYLIDYKGLLAVKEAFKRNL